MWPARLVTVRMTTGRKIAVCLGIAWLLSGTALPAEPWTLANVNVYDPGSGKVLADRCVLIDGERIARVDRCDRLPGSARVFDGHGGWLLPGFRDMHVHALWDESLVEPFFRDFLAWGVTGIRDMASQPETLAATRARIATGELPPLRLVASGPVVDGPQPLFPSHAIAAGDAAGALAAVDRVIAAGGDFIKPYSLLPREAALALLGEARRRGLPVAGHLPAALTAEDAIAHGMAGIEHLAVGAGGLCDLADENDCRRTFARLAAAGVHLTPTLLVRQRRTLLDAEDFETIARVAAMPALVRDDWRNRREQRRARLAPADWAAERQQYAGERRYTELAIITGAPLLAGTDAGELFIPPGLSLHHELALLVAAGMTEREAIAAATRVPADFLGLADEGRVQAGAVADLVLLGSNPLVDINATRDLRAVLLRGTLYDRAALDALRSTATEDR